MNSIATMFNRKLTITNCNPLYPIELELQNGSRITYGRRLELIDKLDEMPSHRVNVNWSSTLPLESLFKDDDLKFSKKAQRLRRSRKTIAGRDFFLGRGGSYEHETSEYINMDFIYGPQWHELLILNYLGSKLKQIWHVAREVTISLITVFSA